jgi:hypothetical protein
VEDYLACVEALTSYLLDKPVRLVAKALSAGGVVVGAAVNRRPDLFCGPDIFVSSKYVGRSSYSTFLRIILLPLPQCTNTV